MDAADLRVFEAVARHGSMNRAADALHTVQSNVTARIRTLEDQLGTPLFDRHSRGVRLTDAGERLLPYAQRVAHLLEEAKRAVREDGAARGRLLLGSLETTAAMRLSPLLANYVAAYPAVDLVLRTGTTAELITQVLEQQLDGAFVCGPVAHAALIEERIFREELVVAAAASAGDPLAAAERSGEARIVVLRAGCSYRQRLEEVLARRGITRVRLLEFGTIETILASVAAGLGITLMPRSLVAAARYDGIVMHPLPPQDAIVDTVFIRHRDSFVPRALTALLELARAQPVPLDDARKRPRRGVSSVG